MARQPRIVIPNQPLHIMHRGNNRQNIFEIEDDFVRIKEDIIRSLSKADCQLHAYVIMSNHLHLLLTPKDKEELKIFMQSMSNRYVRYFNAARKRTETIWEGRYKSCLVDSDNYLFTLYKYIEMNPVKANMVEMIEDYPWSSYHYNALGKEDELVASHNLYDGLGGNREEQAKQYRALFERLEISDMDRGITEATQRGEVLGSSKFHNNVASLLSRQTVLTAHGGDRKSEGYHREQNQAG